jgi:hypothetical protein
MPEDCAGGQGGPPRLLEEGRDYTALGGDEKGAGATRVQPLLRDVMVPTGNGRQSVLLPKRWVGKQGNSAAQRPRSLADFRGAQIAAFRLRSVAAGSRRRGGAHHPPTRNRRHRPYRRQAAARFLKVTDTLACRGVELVPEDEVRGAGVRWALPRARRS